MRRSLLAIGAAVVLLVAGAGAYLYLSDEDPPEKRGSAKVEFDADAGPAEPKPKPRRKAIAEPWPTFGYDIQRTKAGPYGHRPPYRRLWRIDAHDSLEYPPSVAYGNVYVAQQKGLFFALDGKTGKPVFKTKNFKRCAASAPTIANGTVYQSYMDWVGDLSNPCPQGASDPTGFLIAMNARTGRPKWRFHAQPIESSPLLRNGKLYIGSWDGNVYALDARIGKKVWAYQTGDRVNNSAAYFKGRIYIANDSGTVYALNAGSGKLAWSASEATEFFYAAPVAAYGRIYIGSTDGTMYVYGARTGNLLWATPLGTYIYGSAAIYDRKVYVGTYDGKFYALDAGTGDVVWQRDMPSGVHAPPTVLDGLVYVATCATCGSAASRYVKMGVDSTTAFNARTGKRVWRNPAGKYASPIVADEERVYLTGRSVLFGLKPVKGKAKGSAQKGEAKRKRRRS